MPFVSMIDFNNLNLFALPPALVGGLIFLLGFTTLCFERRLRIGGSFFLLTSAVALWLLSFGLLFILPNPSLITVMNLVKLSHIGVSFIPGSMLFFISSVVRSSTRFRKWSFAGIGLSLCFCLVDVRTNWWIESARHYFWGYYPQYKPFSYLFLAFFFAAAFSSLFVLWRSYQGAVSERARGRLKALLIAFSISCLASVDYLANYGIEIYPIGYLPLLIFVFLIADTMQRYHLSDVTSAFAAEKILETMQGVVLVLDLDGIIRVANHRACEVLGYEKSELLGLTAKHIIPASENPGVKTDIPFIQKLLEKPRTTIWGHPMYWKAKSGQLISLSVSMSVMRGREGDKGDGVVYVAQDLRERKRAEQALQEIEDRFQMVVENVRDYSILVLDPSGNIETWNLGAERIFGYHADQIMGAHFSRFYKESDVRAEKFQKELEFAVEFGSVEDEGWRIRKDGVTFWAHTTLTALKNKSNEIQGFLKITRDISEVKKGRQMRLRLASIVESSNDAILIVSRSGEILSWNRGAEKIYGYSSSEVMGQSLSVLFPPDKEQDVSALIEGGLVDGGVESYETVGVKKEGTQIHVSLTVSPILDESEQRNTISVICRNITKVKEAEEILRRRKDLEMKSNFISMVSHELRTPLTVIKMGVDILREGEAGTLSEQQAEWVDMCYRNVSRLTRLISKVLDFQKLESGRMDYEMKHEDLNSVIQEIEKSIELLLRDKKVTFKTELSPDLPQVQMDRDKIIEVLMNVLGNAVKFTADGSITIKTESLEGKVRMTIRDTGIGIKPEDVPKLFSSFTQIHGAVHRTGGTGLGLAISKKIIEQHGGEIWAESEAGKGTTFFIELKVI